MYRFIEKNGEEVRIFVLGSQNILKCINMTGLSGKDIMITSKNGVMMGRGVLLL